MTSSKATRWAADGQDIGVTLQTAPQPTGGHETTKRPDNGTDRMRNSSRWTGQTGRRALYGRTVCGKWPITSPPVSRVQSPVSNQTRPNTKSNKFLLFSFKNLDQMFKMVYVPPHQFDDNPHIPIKCDRPVTFNSTQITTPSNCINLNDLICIFKASHKQTNVNM